MPRSRVSPTASLAVALLAAGLVCAATLLAWHAPAGAGPPAGGQTTGGQTGTVDLAATRSGAPGARVTVFTGGALRAIPHSFLGFSTEYWTLPVDERHIALYGRILSLVRVPGDGPLVLRIGGDSSDHTFFDPNLPDFPHWAYDLSPAWIGHAARVIARNHLRVIIDLNTITGTPALAAAWVREARARFPGESVIGLEIGNEPDLYDHDPWAALLPRSGFDLGTRPREITPAGYARDYLAYAQALGPVAPGVPLLAPALASPHTDRFWITALLHAPHPRLRLITVHEYPYSACARPGDPMYPSVAALLSPHATGAMYSYLRPTVREAARDGLPVRVTEFNSITCGGVPGISDSFATALWAPNALFQMLRAGVVAADLHVRAFAFNPPFVFTARGFRARPLMYGLILFARMLGPGARLAPAHVAVPRGERLEAWAVQVGAHRLNVLLTDPTRRPVDVALTVPGASGPATVLRLTAPSASSRGGVRLGGRRLTDQVRWVGVPRRDTIARSDGGYRLTVGAAQATMLTVRD